MSRKENRSISAALAAATCSLLGSGMSAPVDAQEERAWDFNTSLLYYGEDGDRVKDSRNDNDMSVRIEAYRQTGSVPSSQLIGNQAGRDNYPDLNAIILQVAYRF